MNLFTKPLSRTVKAGVLALALVAPVVYAEAPATPAQQDFRAHYTEHVQKQLSHLAALLKLQPNQQAAWQAFAQARQAEIPAMKRPPEDANAVELAKFRADRATEMAQHMTQTSQAMAGLWAVLTPDQRMTFDRMTQREMMHSRHHFMMKPFDQDHPMEREQPAE
jgi:hypothetical protein